MASLGCGNPTAVAELRAGRNRPRPGFGWWHRRAALGAPGSARPAKAYGLDMTDEMLALAREKPAKAGVENVEWLRGQIEEIPLPAASVDVVISNCVINLSADKTRVLAEVARVLRPRWSLRRLRRDRRRGHGRRDQDRHAGVHRLHRRCPYPPRVRGGACRRRARWRRDRRDAPRPRARRFGHRPRPQAGPDGKRPLRLPSECGPLADEPGPSSNAPPKVGTQPARQAPPPPTASTRRCSRR